MARTGKQFAKLTGDYSSINVYATWELRKQDASTGESTIRLREYLTYSSNGTYASSYSTFKLNGTTVKSGSYSYSTTGDHLVGYKDITVKHNEDGTFPDTKLTAYAYSYHFTNKPSKSATLTSADIPDIQVASTIKEVRTTYIDPQNGVPFSIALDMNLLEDSVYDQELGQPHTTMLDVNVGSYSYHLFDAIPTSTVSIYFDEEHFETIGTLDSTHSITPILFPLSWQQICAMIPNETSIPIEFILTTYDYGSPIATTFYNYFYEVTKANVDFEVSLKSDEQSYSLTGSYNKFIENFGKVIVNANAITSKNGANIQDGKTYWQRKYILDNTDITNPVATETFAQGILSTDNFYIFDDIGTNNSSFVDYSIDVTDSRGYKATSHNVRLPSEEYEVIKYKKPILDNVAVARPEQLAPYVYMSISGSFWNDNFGTVQNQIKLQYRYILNTQEEYTDWLDLNPTINADGTFSFYGNVGSEEQPLVPSANSATFEIRVIDSTGSEAKEINFTIPKGKSMFDLGENYLSFNGELCINDDEVPCFIEDSVEDDGSRNVTLYDSEGKKLNITPSIEGGFVKVTLPTDLDNISTSYNYFHPFNYEDNDVLVEGSKLTYEKKTVNYGDRTNSPVYGATVGSGVEYIRVSYNIRVLNNHTSNLTYTTDIGLLRDGEVTVIGGTSDTLMPSSRHTTTGKVTQIPVREGDFLFVYAYKGSKTADLDVIASWDMTNVTFEVTHINGLTVINNGNGGSGSGTTDYERLDNIPRINGIRVIGNKTAEDYGIQTLEAGENVEIVDNKISVLTTDEAQEDNTKPITSSGVYTQLGNIAILLETI